VTQISLVLPYFNRAEATTRALKRHAELYPDVDMEIIVVDDGSEQPYSQPPNMPWLVNVIFLPKKGRPLNPCLPFNIGVQHARGDVIALSNPEIMHREAVLEQMAMMLSKDADYVSAACWCPDNNRWHAHSTRKPLYADRTTVCMPEYAQYHFLAVLSREIWDACGGFDNDYREGAGYDDNDFLMRLARVGARFEARDDLVVEHSRNGAHAAWTPQMFERNRKLFLSKWGI
jgi:glycosyltransferase involved in cell wall biosynthesis